VGEGGSGTDIEMSHPSSAVQPLKLVVQLRRGGAPQCEYFGFRSLSQGVSV
jgi:hypothetical protein